MFIHGNKMHQVENISWGLFVHSTINIYNSANIIINNIINTKCCIQTILSFVPCFLNFKLICWLLLNKQDKVGGSFLLCFFFQVLDTKHSISSTPHHHKGIFNNAVWIARRSETLKIKFVHNILNLCNLMTAQCWTI